MFHCGSGSSRDRARALLGIPVAVLAATVLLLGCTGLGGRSVKTGERVVFEDRFKRGPAKDWMWLRENPGAWRVREKALEIRVEPGVADTVKNALLRKAPDRSRGTFAIEVTITNHTKPTQRYEPAGIT